MLKIGTSKIALMSGAGLALSVVAPSWAQEAKTTDSAPREVTQSSTASDEIVVTARKRSESLMTVPVSVSALGTAQIERYNAVDLTSIAQLVPGVTVSTTGSTGGASLNIRGVSSPATVVGFEQSVSVAIDNVQTSNGRIATLGFFDVAQVEVLKGPQALFFGRNSPAGVISIKTKGPTDTFQVEGGVDYEFVAHEVTTRAAVSGPVTDRLGARLALQYRHMRGWLDNIAQSVANPYFTSAQPAGAAIIPAPSSRHNEESDYTGRLTLDYALSDTISATFKAFGQHKTDNGPGFNGGQHIGPCATGRPNFFGFVDPIGECRQDNRISAANIPQAVADRTRLSDGKSAPFGETNAQLLSLTLSGDFDAIKISSNTGYNRIKYKSSYSQDNTSLGQSIVLERYFTREFSQEIRATTDFQSPVNFVAGAYYQDVLTEYRSSFVLNYGLYDPVSDLYNPYVRLSEQVGKTYSVFGQAIANITDKLELTAGGRFTRETKSYRTGNEFGRNAFATPTTLFPGSNEPGILKDVFKGNNFSPEVTLSWHPTPDSTLYGSYKTGYKSGGFLLGGFLNRTSTIGDFDFGPEKVKGFEIGAKGYLADRKLRLSATAYAYNFSNLQVNVFDPSLFAYVVANAGQLRQRGVDVEANFRANDNLSLHAGATYARNRFKNFVGQCYGYGFPAGSTRATATPPPGCSFVNSTSLILQQDFNGRAPARSPDFTANAGIVAEHTLDAVKLGATGDLFYTDGYYASDTQSPFSWQPNFIRVNASLSISDRDDRWKVALTGKNLTNEYYLVLGAEQTGGASNPGQFGQQRGFVSRGREVILQTSFKF